MALETLEKRAPETVQELEQMAHALARELWQVLEGRTLCTGVVLQALMVLHQGTVRQMPAQAQRDVGFAMAGYAGGLIATPLTGPERPSEAVALQFAAPSTLQ